MTRCSTSQEIKKKKKKKGKLIDKIQLYNHNAWKKLERWIIPPNRDEDIG